MIRFLMLLIVLAPPIVSAQDDLSTLSLQAMKQAAEYFHQKVAVNGGYVYEYSLDLQQRQGEGKAAPTEIWVQPPGTPTVGMAFLSAFEATGDQQFLTAATHLKGEAHVISSELFSRIMQRLSEYLAAVKTSE